MSTVASGAKEPSEWVVSLVTSGVLAAGGEPG